LQRRLPVDETDSKRIIEEGYYFVGRSLLTKDVLESRGKALLIPRPHRFG